MSNDKTLQKRSFTIQARVLHANVVNGLQELKVFCRFYLKFPSDYFGRKICYEWFSGESVCDSDLSGFLFSSQISKIYQVFFVIDKSKNLPCFRCCHVQISKICQVFSPNSGQLMTFEEFLDMLSSLRLMSLLWQTSLLWFFFWHQNWFELFPALTISGSHLLLPNF